MYQSFQQKITERKFTNIDKTPLKLLQEQSIIQSEELEDDRLEIPAVNNNNNEKVSSACLIKPESQSNTQKFHSFKDLYHSMPLSGNKTIPDAFTALKFMNYQIYDKIKVLGSLKESFYDNQQKVFLKTFINIMDRMSDELIKYNQLYKNIDQEIDRQQQCVKMRERLNFYQDQCLFLKNAYEKLQQQITETQERNQKAKQANAELEKQLKKYKLKSMKYRNSKQKSNKLKGKSLPDRRNYFANQFDSLSGRYSKHEKHRKRANSFYVNIQKQVF